jgi:hypothetical protein
VYLVIVFLSMVLPMLLLSSKLKRNLIIAQNLTLNFLVDCPRGTMFVKFVDASAHVKDASLLCDLLDEFIREVGPQHVVQVITDNTANYVVAGRMLMQRYPTLF